MLSLYSIIKGNSIVEAGNEDIVTEYKVRESPKLVKGEVRNIDDGLSNYRRAASSILEDARAKREEMLNRTTAEAEKLMKEAYEKAYAKAYEEGKKKGYDDAFKKYVPEAESKAEEIKGSADKLLLNAQKEYEKYFAQKESEIKNMVSNIARTVLKTEIKNKDCMNELIKNLLNDIKNSKNIIIKVNKNYVEELKKNVEELKPRLVNIDKVFVFEDDIELGKAVIIKDNGKITFDINKGLDEIQKLLE